MSESRILVLEGYDASPRNRSATRREAVEWNACKVERKVDVYRRGGVDQAPSVACSNNTKFWVLASTKKQAHKLAVQKFRGEKKARRRLGDVSPAQSAAQRRFTAAAHACRADVGTGGKNRSYLTCMKQKLTK